MQAFSQNVCKDCAEEDPVNSLAVARIAGVVTLRRCQATLTGFAMERRRGLVRECVNRSAFYFLMKTKCSSIFVLTSRMWVKYWRKPPEGLDANWIPTAGKRPLPTFRFYGGIEALHTKTFKMPDFEVVN
jgi:hypothetical protein